MNHIFYFFHPIINIVYGVEGYGPRPIGQDDPPIPEWEWQFLGFNEPNQADQSDIPPEVAALEYKKLQDMYPDKVMISPATGKYFFLNSQY